MAISKRSRVARTALPLTLVIDREGRCFVERLAPEDPMVVCAFEEWPFGDWGRRTGPPQHQLLPVEWPMPKRGRLRIQTSGGSIKMVDNAFLAEYGIR